MTTKTITTPTGKTITVEIVRKVQDKINYADGYNIVVGREIVDYTNITLRDTDGKVLAKSHALSNVHPKIDAKAIKGGAIGYIGNVYLRQDTYDLVSRLIADVDAETPKSDEQIQIESDKAAAAAENDAWYNSQDARQARKLEAAMDDPNSDY